MSSKCDIITLVFYIAISYTLCSSTENDYRSGTVNSKSFVGKVSLRIEWKFEFKLAKTLN